MRDTPQAVPAISRIPATMPAGTGLRRAKGRPQARMQSSVTAGITICTFHSLGLSILRAEHEKIGYPANFTIYSPYEQSELMKRVMADEKISTERFSAQAIVSAISKMKNDPSLRERSAFLVSNITNAVANRLFEPYCRAMKVRAALDFDDLIALTVGILKNDDAVRMKYAKKYKYINNFYKNLQK